MYRRRLIVGDTDALLCFGSAGKAEGIDLLWRRFHSAGGGIVVPLQVRQELERKLKVGGPLAVSAGRLARPLAATFIGTDRTRWSAEEREPIRQKILDAERRFAASRGRPPKLHGHDGEIEAILLARRERAIMMSNDRAAREVARSEGVAAATFAMVLAAEVRDGQLTAEDAAGICQRIEKDNWPGIDSPSVATITTLTRFLPPGL